MFPTNVYHCVAKRVETGRREHLTEKPQKSARARRESGFRYQYYFIRPCSVCRTLLDRSTCLLLTAVRHETHVDALLTSAKRPFGNPKEPVTLDPTERRKLFRPGTHVREDRLRLDHLFAYIIRIVERSITLSVETFRSAIVAVNSNFFLRLMMTFFILHIPFSFFF